MPVVLVLLVTLPLAATIACAAVSQRVAAVVSALTGVITLVLAVVLVPGALEHTQYALRYLRADPLSVVFVLGTCFLYAATAIYSVGYLAAEARAVRDESVEQQIRFARHSRQFYLGLNAFAWSMICAPLVNELALLWIAVEITTVVSALLVALDNTEGATEAAWKYVLIASSGLGIALLATIFMYYAGSQVLGQSYDLAFDPLMRGAAHLPHTAVRLAFVLAVVGYGTKVGLFPVHTWLPDAHAEAPTPVSALLSGSLLAVSFYAILRYYQISVVALGPRFPQTVLLVFGVLSLLLAALYLLEQRDIKRLLAYSSVEHMGILAIGVSFGAPLALSGVLLHVLAHAAAKGNAFMGAGVLVRKFGTKELRAMADGIRVLPWSGPLFLIAVLALSAMPPFGLFRSEFQIVAGGFAHARNAATAVLVCLVTLAFLGLTLATTRILFRPVPDTAEPDAQALARGEPSRWMVAPVVAGVLVLLILGLAPPADLINLLNHAASDLAVGAR
ncbi:MAG TPA: proton-conducting transporter membrane subunit [Mycobacterium sp.]|nr:proton-conducting transporter membrane subunit [Mycobacterium sp.]